MPLHSALTGSDLHEPKGAASAASDTVCTANGSGGTSWAKITSSNLDSSAIFNTNKYVFVITFPDISTAGSIYIPFPFACTVNRIEGALQGAIGTADTILTFRNNAGTSMGTMTIAYSGSAAGDVDTVSPSSNNTFTAGQRIKIDSDGGSSNTINEILTIWVTQTA